MKSHSPLYGRGRKKDSDRKNGRRLRIDIQRTGLGAATIVAISILLSVHLLPDKVSLIPGDVATQDIRATHTVRYSDVHEYRKLKEQAASSVGKLYDKIPYALDESLRELNSIFTSLSAARMEKNKSPDERVNQARLQIRERLGMDVPLQAVSTMVGAPEPAYVKIKEVVAAIVRDVNTQEIRDDIAEITRVHQQINQKVEQLLSNPEYSTTAADIIKAVVKPNMVFNFERTAAEREKAMANVKPVYRSIRTGDLVIGKGEVVTREHEAKFTALGLRQPSIEYRTVMLLSALVAFLVGLVIIYLARYQKAVYSSKRLLLLISLVVVMCILGLNLGQGLLVIKLPGLSSAHLGILLTTTAGMILATLLNPQIAVLIVAELSIASGLVMNNELRYATSTLISGLVSIYAVANIRGRTDQMRTVGVVSATNIAIVLIMGGLFGDTWSDIGFGSVWAIAIAVMATSLFWYITWLLERPFKVTTHVSLLELADTNNPILKRLVVEAPGTYTHSITCGRLAESAAEAIGADGLFARVASYYHDIGKIRRPQFFVENQGVENAHDKLNPTLSALVITSHIKDGLELAKELRLPPSIQEVVLQHHGTSLVQYFYNQVSDQTDPSLALEQQFRYEGPKPETKEAAIVMLADSVEAASRSMAKPSHQALESLIDKIVNDKVADGQLDHSELTFREIGMIKEAFARTLKGVLHARIEYPDIPGVNGKTSDNGDSNKELAEPADKPETVGEHCRESVEG